MALNQVTPSISQRHKPVTSTQSALLPRITHHGECLEQINISVWETWCFKHFPNFFLVLIMSISDYGRASILPSLQDVHLSHLLPKQAGWGWASRSPASSAYHDKWHISGMQWGYWWGWESLGMGYSGTTEQDGGNSPTVLTSITHNLFLLKNLKLVMIIHIFNPCFWLFFHFTSARGLSFQTLDYCLLYFWGW